MVIFLISSNFQWKLLYILTFFGRFILWCIYQALSTQLHVRSLFSHFVFVLTSILRLRRGIRSLLIYNSGNMVTHTACRLTIRYFVYDYIYLQDNSLRECNRNKQTWKCMDQSIRIIRSRDHLITELSLPMHAGQPLYFNVLELLYTYMYTSNNNYNSFSHKRFSMKGLRLSRVT